MTAEQQNDAIARLMGKRPSCGNAPELHLWGAWQNQAKPVPFRFRKCTQCPALHIDGERFVSIGSGDEVPNYTYSLDAMHEAEESIPLDKWVDYVKTLAPMTYGALGVAHATAAERAEAFLRTMGKWIEEEKAAA